MNRALRKRPSPAAAVPELLGEENLRLEAVGGKALALDRIIAGGFSVPPTRVLTTLFFGSWWLQLSKTQAWRRLLAASAGPWSEIARDLRAEVMRLSFDDAQRLVIAAVVTWIGEGRCTLRCSPPDQRADGPQFAGIYDAQVSVPADEIGHAVRLCFASAVSARAFAYKEARNLPLHRPRMAVLVQPHVEGVLSGELSTANPHNNDHDECVVTLQGESARYVCRSPSDRALPPGLSSDQLSGLLDLGARVRSHWGGPVAIRWTLDILGGSAGMTVLSARPVAGLFPVPDEMMTETEEPRRLYMDVGLSPEPVSDFGLAVWMRLARAAMPSVAVGDPRVDWLFGAGARMYVEIGRVRALLTRGRGARWLRATEPEIARILATADAKTYRAADATWWSMVVACFGIALRLGRVAVRFVVRTIALRVAPMRGRRRLEVARLAHRQRIARAVELGTHAVRAGAPLSESLDRLADEVARASIESTIPAMFACWWGAWPLRDIDGDMHPPRAAATSGDSDLDRRLRQLAEELPPDRDLEGLSAAVAQRRLGAVFHDRWDALIARHGHRGAGEEDPAAPRYADVPELLLSRMLEPKERPRPPNVDRAASGGRRRRRVMRAAAIAEALGGYRAEAWAQCVEYVAVTRRWALIVGARLEREGRLDAIDDVFDASVEAIDAALEDEAFDLRAACRSSSAFRTDAARRGGTAPKVLDSRGRILRSPSDEPIV